MSCAVPSVTQLSCDALPLNRNQILIPLLAQAQDLCVRLSVDQRQSVANFLFSEMSLFRSEGLTWDEDCDAFNSSLKTLIPTHIWPCSEDVYEFASKIERIDCTPLALETHEVFSCFSLACIGRVCDLEANWLTDQNIDVLIAVHVQNQIAHLERLAHTAVSIGLQKQAAFLLSKERTAKEKAIRAEHSSRGGKNRHKTSDNFNKYVIELYLTGSYEDLSVRRASKLVFERALESGRVDWREEPPRLLFDRQEALTGESPPERIQLWIGKYLRERRKKNDQIHVQKSTG